MTRGFLCIAVDILLTCSAAIGMFVAAFDGSMEYTIACGFMALFWQRELHRDCKRYEVGRG